MNTRFALVLAAYAKAQAQAQRQTAAALRGRQRGRANRRHGGCKANAPTWITTTWTVNSVPDWVEAHHPLRTAQLLQVVGLDTVTGLTERLQCPLR